MIPNHDSLESRRISPTWVIVVTVCALIGLAAVVPSPYALERPGPVVDALGEIRTEDGEVPVITITGAEVFDPDGELQVLSVSLRGTPERPLSWLAAIPGFVDPTQQLVPREKVFPEGTDSEQRENINTALMQSSQVQASAAALELLGLPVTSQVLVSRVHENGAAHGKLKPNDAILAVNGEPVSSVADIREILNRAGIDTDVPVSIDRDGAVSEILMTPQLSSDGNPRLGIDAAIQVELPIDIEYEMDRIGGPSAGLTFALAIYTLLSQEDVLGGQVVSATGTMSVGGGVGPIGGLPQKIWGAARAGSELMLFPKANCADVPEVLPEGLTLAPVESLQEALEVIAEVRSGKTPAGLENCVTISS